MYCIWYPLTERAAPLRFRRNLERAGIRKVLDATLSVLPDDAAVGMRGAGVVVINPPWMLDERLGELLPDLHRLLVPDGNGRYERRVVGGRMRRSPTTLTRRQFLVTKTSTRWSLTMPVACMWAYMIVVPTNLKPRCFRSG